MHGTSAKITYLKLFLASNSSNLTYLFWHVGDTEYSLGLSFMAIQGHMGSDRWKEHISAARTSGHGGVHC